MIRTFEENWNVEYLSGVTNEVVELVSVSSIHLRKRAEIPEPSGPAIRGKSYLGRARAGRRMNYFCSMSGTLKTGSASIIILLLTSAKNCSQPKKIAQRIKLLSKFAHKEQIYCEQKFAQ